MGGERDGDEREGDGDDGRDGAVFRALADANRRRLLDALFAADGQTLGALCEVLPAITRFGVMKHLAVLVEAGLVVTHKAGRRRLHYLNPVPIRELQHRWIAKYVAAGADSLVALRHSLEQGS